MSLVLSVVKEMRQAGGTVVMIVSSWLVQDVIRCIK